jgi:hypothetical protein
MKWTLLILDGKSCQIGFLGHEFTNGNKLFVELDAVNDRIPKFFEIGRFNRVFGYKFDNVFVYLDFHGTPLLFMGLGDGQCPGEWNMMWTAAVKGSSVGSSRIVPGSKSALLKN